MEPVVSTQFVPVEAFTSRMAKLVLLSTPEMPLKSTVIWLFQPAANLTYEPMTVPCEGSVLLEMTADVPPEAIVALFHVLPSVVYCTCRLASASAVA